MPKHLSYLVLATQNPPFTILLSRLKTLLGHFSERPNAESNSQACKYTNIQARFER